ncbi:hypothetical protein IAU60_003976 [Kwoniella sp. DSM 27419]
MDALTPQQAQALWAAGGFVILTGLPEGSEFGIDGTYHIVRRFSGIKFLPPGLHLVAWSTSSPQVPTTASRVHASGLESVRCGLLRYTGSKERVVLQYDARAEMTSSGGGAGAGGGDGAESVVSDDHLRGLDKEMAPYPFEGHERWKSLTSEISRAVLEQVVPTGRVDGMTTVQGEMEDTDSRELRKELEQLAQGREGQAGPGEQDQMRFARFNLRRSWREGAVGEEITRYSRDKSWLLGDVVTGQLGGDLDNLLAQLQLAFVLLLHLSSFSALLVYKRLLALLCQSSSFLLDPSTYMSKPTLTQEVAIAYVKLVNILSFQIQAIPGGTFDTELPEMDAFYLDQIEALQRNLAAAGFRSSTGTSCSDEQGGLNQAWIALQSAADKWGWDIGGLAPGSNAPESEDEEEEEGEYAPMVVEM